MALQRYDTRLASEEDYLPQIRSDWASIVDPFEKQREAEALLGAGYTPESLIGQFNRQFGGGATLDDLNFLLSYGKPSDTAGALSTVDTGYYGGPDTSVQQSTVSTAADTPSGLASASVPQLFSESWFDYSPVSKQAYLNSLLSSGYGQDELLNTFNTLFPTRQATSSDIETLMNYGKAADTGAQGALSQIQTSDVRDTGDLNTAKIAEALNIPVEDASALMGTTSNVLETIGSTYDQDALNRLTASVDAEAISEDLSSKVDEAAADTVRDFQGNEFSGSEILNLAKQISGSIDTSKIGGAVYGTKGESIGFDYEEAKKILGREPTAADQVLLDMARSLRQKGVTDLSQIKVEDVVVNQESSVYTDPETGEKFLVDADGAKIRSLTPEEVSSIRLKEVGSGDSTYTQEVLDTEVKTKQTVGPDGKPIFLYGEDGGNVFGETYTGEGATDYVMEIDPNTGLPKFYTTGRSTSDMEKIQMALTFASFIPGVAPFVQAVQGTYALSQGDPLAAAAAFAGAGGYTDAARVLGAINAAKNGDIASAAFSLAGTSFAGDVLKTDLGGGFTLNDVVTAGKIVSGIDSGNYGMALSAAGDLMKSPDLKAAAAGLNVYNAIQSGNPVAMLNALDDAKKVVEYIGGNTAAKETIQSKEPLGSGLQLPGAIDTGLKLGDTYSLTVDDEKKLGTSEGDEAAIKLFMQGKNLGLEGSDLLNFVNQRSQEIIASQMPGAKLEDLDFSTTADLTLGFDAYKYAKDKNMTESDALAFAGQVMGGKTKIPDELKLDANSQKVADDLKADQEKIASQKTYNDAFRTARDLFGPGMTFTWKGETFSTSTREEDPKLAAASDLKIIERLMSGEATELEKAVKDTPVTYSGPTIFGRPVGTVQDAVNATIRMGTVVKDLSAGLGSGFGDFLNQMGDLAYMMTAKQGEPVYDEAGNLMGYQQVLDPVVARDNILSTYGKQLSDYYGAGISEKSNQQWKDFVKDVDEAPVWLKPIVSLTSGLENFGGVMSRVGKETGEEIAPLLSGFGIAKALGYGTSGTINTTAVVATLGDMAETASGSFNNVMDQLKDRKDMSEEDKFFAASQAASNAMLTTAVFGYGANAYLLKSMIGEQLAPAAARILGPSAVEYVTEKAESKLQSLGDTAAVKGGYDKLTQEDFDNSETDSTISALLGAKTAGTISGTATVISHINNEMVNAMPGDSKGVFFVRNEKGETALVPAGDFKVGDKIDLSSTPQIDDTADLVSQFNFNPDRAEDIVANVNNLQFFKDDRVSDPAEDSAFRNIVEFQVEKTGVPKGTFDTSIKPDTKVDESAGVVTETKTDQGTGITTQTSTDQDTGTTTQVVNDPSANTTTEIKNDVQNNTQTETVVDNNTNVTTQNTIDLSTNQQTTIQTDANSDVSTVSTVDPNTNQTIDATIDPNSDVATLSTVDANTKSDVTIDTNNNTLTETKVDTNTNQTIDTTIDSNNNTQTTNVVNPDSNSTITIDTNSNVATNTTIDTKNNVETNTTIDLNTNQVTTVTTDINTNQSTTTTKPVDDIPITTLIKTLDPTKEDEPKKTKPPTKTPTGGYQMPLALGAALAANPSLAAEFENLFSGPAKKFKSPLDDFMQQVDENYAQQVADQEAAEAAQRAQEEEMRKYYSYGRERDIDDILGEGLLEESPLSESFEGFGMSEMFPRAAKAGGLMTPLMAKGGNPPAVHYAGKPRIDFRKGAHVAGPGDGQSDDIPAMLADGEFVFPADVVAALGNGSTKAGSDKLYEMMHEIRRSYRSAKPKDLPPPAKKSPLEYLSKKGRR